MSSPVLFIFAAILGIMLPSLLGGFPLLLLAIGCQNVLVLILFGWDKLQAQRGGSRIPEAVLHAFTLGGGAIGAAFGRHLFNHKTRKFGFSVVSLIGLALLGLSAISIGKMV